MGEKTSMYLSVIVINKNRGNVLDYCLNAIISQMEYKDELILVDDSSTDDSLKVIKKFRNSITQFVQINSGGNRSKARNAGAQLCRNEIIIFIDSDVIIGPNNLEITRSAYEDNELVGTTGNVAGNSCNELQFELIAKKKATELLQEILLNFNVIAEYYGIFDYRYNNPDLTRNPYDNWPFYYTSYASARKSVFVKIRGFDENFKTWGSEDIEFGYRLNQVGKIVHLNECIAFHFPHEKNYYENSLCNINNLYYILKKHQNLDFEIYTAFLGSDRKLLKEELVKLYVYISQEQNSRISIKEKEMAIHFSNNQFKNGVIEYSLNKNIEKMELFGFAIPFINKSFDVVYISKKYKILPESIFCRVVQEAIRLAKRVLLEKGELKQKPYLDKDIFHNNSPLLLGVSYISERYLDFEINDYDARYYEIKWAQKAGIGIQKNIFCI